MTLRIPLWAAVLTLVCALPAGAADKPAVAARVEIARSSQVIVDGQPADDVLLLRIRHTADQSIADTKDLTVSVDGKAQAVKLRPDASYSIPMDDLQGSGLRVVEVTVTHDGLREILTGKIPAIDTRPAAVGLLGDHKQLAWWVLNVVILLIGVMALSRKKSY